MRRGVRQSLLRLLLRSGCALLLTYQFVVTRKPLKIFLLALLLCQQDFLFVSKCLQTLLQVLLLFLAQQHNACGLRFAHLQRVACRFVFFKNHGGNLAVNFRAGQFLQQLCAIARFSIQEGGKLPLREQHRAGKATIVQPGECGGLFQLIRDFVGQNFAVFAAGQLYARCL